MKVTFIKQQLAVLLLITFFSAACGSKKTGSMNNGTPTHTLDGYQAHTLLSVAIPEKGSADQPVKIEIIPGKKMEVDCNHHSLMGEFENRELSDGNRYYVFESNGEAVSTLMACPDNIKRTEFVRGKSIFIDSKDAIPPVVYAPEGIEIKYRHWNSSPSYAMGKDLNYTLETEATGALKAYPESQEGYDRYILFLPEIKNSQKEHKVEIIPGVTTEVDCNLHGLMGTFVEKNIEGWGYSYLVFDSDGNIRSTRMACPDNTRRTEFMTGATHLMDYNSRLPVVVFVPKKGNFSVQYRIWEAGELK
ncbi:ecotin family protein [uncultured Proteiniphilum sp.]|uniref:ecotin family protein n=1 Tax=uncultured Proteiniphilum sp. TaxID=497637 RepID=UPI002634E0BE|nr:ecotin family protein [uncultured Proteiniphilum sp.]